MQQQAYEAAMGEHLRHIQEGKPTRLDAAKRVSEMFAAAVNADPQWFWHRPNR